MAFDGKGCRDLRPLIRSRCKGVLKQENEWKGELLCVTVFLRWIRRAASLESPALVNLYIERKPFYYIKTHKTAINRPVDQPGETRYVTHILSKVSCFLLKSFHFRTLYRNDRFFPHTNPYISNVTEQCRCSPMLIFRAWATYAYISHLRRRINIVIYLIIFIYLFRLIYFMLCNIM